MNKTIWLHACAGIVPGVSKSLIEALQASGIYIVAPDLSPQGLGLCLTSEVTPELVEFLQWGSQQNHCHIFVVVTAPQLPDEDAAWEILQHGAADVLFWTDTVGMAKQISARVKRWVSVEQFLDGTVSNQMVVGKSASWRSALRGIIEAAHFSDTTVLVLGESGTGKEVAARLIHQLDARPYKRELVVLDCSTIVSDLSGSEFFGHERGAFTGAVADRQGAFALANGGTLFLDEVGELPLPLQAQLLRVIQERTYKRVGGSAWHRTEFRLVCATNRDLPAMVSQGTFRADLYYRITGFVAKLPALRERLEDVLPLAEYFAAKFCPLRVLPKIDPVVKSYLLHREYPGNVRDLQQTVSRLMGKCADDGTISIGYVPKEERIHRTPKAIDWHDAQFESVIQRAVLCGTGLKEIGHAAEDCAIRCATRAENGSLQRAARRLGVTDRALQLRRANGRALSGGTG